MRLSSFVVMLRASGGKRQSISGGKSKALIQRRGWGRYSPFPLSRLWVSRHASGITRLESTFAISRAGNNLTSLLAFPSYASFHVMSI